MMLPEGSAQARPHFHRQHESAQHSTRACHTTSVDPQVLSAAMRVSTFHKAALRFRQ